MRREMVLGKPLWTGVSEKLDFVVKESVVRSQESGIQTPER